MYVTVRTVAVKRGQCDQFITTWEAVVAPHLRTIPGFQEGYVLAAPERDSVLLVHIWAHEAAIHAWHDSPAHTAGHTELAAYWVAPPQGDDYAVRVHVVPDNAPDGGAA